MVLEPSQQLVVTCRDQVLTNAELRIMQEDLLLCDHKEANSMMMLNMHTKLLRIHSQLSFELLTLMI